MNAQQIYGGVYGYNYNFSVFYTLALYSWFAGVLIFIVLFEKIHQSFFNKEEMKKPKYFLTISNVVFMAIAGFSYDLKHLLFMIDVWIIIGILFWLSIQASKELQVVSILIIIGANISLFGAQIRAIKHIVNISPVMPPILMIIGSIIMISPFFIDIEKLLEKKPLFHWKILIISHSLLLFLAGSTLFLVKLPLYLTIYNFLQNIPIYIMLIVFGIIQKHKKDKLTSERLERPGLLKHSDKEGLENLFRGFTKPKHLTEEEVSVAKENRICLVCKSKLVRNIYICPDCNAFYCAKCSSTLAKLENACWVCGSRFDESQPIKKLEQKDEEIVEIHKTEVLDDSSKKLK